MVVRSLGLTHSHFLEVAIELGQDNAAFRAVGVAAWHLLLPEFHAQEVHLAQAFIVVALVMHLFSR